MSISENQHADSIRYLMEQIRKCVGTMTLDNISNGYC